MALAPSSLLRHLARLRVFVCVGISILGSSNSYALATLPTTGTCAFIGSLQYLPNARIGPGMVQNVIATLNFETKTLVANILINLPVGPRPTPVPLDKQAQYILSGPFTASAGPVEGSYNISSTINLPEILVPPGTQRRCDLQGRNCDPIQTRFLSWNVVPVNGGNTLLMQMVPGQEAGDEGAMAGVCQF